MIGLACVAVLAVLVRVGAVGLDAGYEPRHDAFDYDRHGRSIAVGAGYPQSQYVADGGPTAIRGPAYPYLLGAAYAVAGPVPDAGRMLDALLGGVVVVLVGLLARAIWGDRIALVAAALTAIFPPLVTLSQELMTETLFLALILAAALAVLRSRRAGLSLRWAAAAGALCGLGALTRSPGPVLIIPIAVGLLARRPWAGLRTLAPPAVAIACMIIVMTPWTLRNVVEFGRFVPVTTSSGFALAGTYNDQSLTGDDRAAWQNPALLPRYQPLFERPGIDEATLDVTLRREALEFAASHPGYAAQVVISNLARLFAFEGGSVVWFGQEVVDSGSAPG